MATYLMAFLVLSAVVGIMAIGLLKKKPIAGTCASLNNFNNTDECVVCGKKADEREGACAEQTPQALKQSLYYAADKPQKQIRP